MHGLTGKDAELLSEIRERSAERAGSVGHKDCRADIETLLTLIAHQEAVRHRENLIWEETFRSHEEILKAHGASTVQGLVDHFVEERGQADPSPRRRGRSLKRLPKAFLNAVSPGRLRRTCWICGTTRWSMKGGASYQSPIEHASYGDACARCVAMRAIREEDVVHLLVRRYGRTRTDHRRLTVGTVYRDGGYLPMEAWIDGHARAMIKSIIGQREQQKIATYPKTVRNTNFTPGGKPPIVLGREAPWLLCSWGERLQSAVDTAVMLEKEPALLLVLLEADHDKDPLEVRSFYRGIPPRRMQSLEALLACRRIHKSFSSDMTAILGAGHPSWTSTFVEFSRHGGFLFPDAHPDDAWFDIDEGHRVVILLQADNRPYAEYVHAMLAHFAEFHPETSLAGRIRRAHRAA